MELNDQQENYKTGYIAIFRSIWHHWIWKDPIKFQWWIDLLLLVNYKENKINIGNQIYECKRGQTIISLSNLARRWNCSKDATRNFLKLLAKDSMILHESYAKTTRITICNYDNYQTILHVEQTIGVRGTNDRRTIGVRSTDTNNKVKKDKEVKKGIKENRIVIIPFESIEFLNAWDLWKEYKKLQHKFEYKTVISEQAALNDLIKISGGDEKTSIEFINNAISKGWQGIYPIKITQNGKETRTVASRSDEIDGLVDAVHASRKP